MMPTPATTEADRIALRDMFKAIAEYGRKVRLRRQAEEKLSPMQEIPVEFASSHKQELTGHARRKKRRGRSDKR